MTLETEFYQALDAVLGPIASSGVAAPGVLPAGLIVLETTGWRSGRPHRTPVLATAFGDRLLVSTYRGRRSHWVQNLLHNPDLRYWTGEESHAATACVVAPDEALPDTHSLPQAAQAWFQGVADVSGCAFVVLSPKGR
ncbi:MAG: nitroreductase family deazaflavin-dependent oxidoreductase [Chloroflexi bacterium]|nr:nitroreductase family deazaflavin-dependent oxidoreductase [Chloroflexota bacterium]